MCCCRSIYSTLYRTLSVFIFGRRRLVTKHPPLQRPVAGLSSTSIDALLLYDDQNRIERSTANWWCPVDAGGGGGCRRWWWPLLSCLDDFDKQPTVMMSSCFYLISQLDDDRPRIMFWLNKTKIYWTSFLSEVTRRIMKEFIELLNQLSIYSIIWSLIAEKSFCLANDQSKDLRNKISELTERVVVEEIFLTWSHWLAQNFHVDVL